MESRPKNPLLNERGFFSQTFNRDITIEDMKACTESIMNFMEEAETHPGDPQAQKNLENAQGIAMSVYYQWSHGPLTRTQKEMMATATVSTSTSTPRKP